MQNLLVLRFANGIFEPVWNRRYVDHVQITAAETLGVEHRGAYYEEAGALRDMIQTHLIQLFSLVAMEPPAAFDADAVRDEKVKVLRAVRRSRRQSERTCGARPVRAGRVDGRAGARPIAQEERVAPDSTPRRTPRSSCSSTTGAGRACRSTCAPASGCRGA